MSEVPEWASSLSQSESFAQEQEKLSHVWTFLGFGQDIPNVNDWFKTTLGGRSIFIQRFDEGLRGFENLCPHRFYPVRTEQKGNGPVVCGFHQWRFDACGNAIGVPKCKQVYCKTPKELNAGLNKIEVSVCGGLIFGRFGVGPSLQDWLGPSYDVLSHLTVDLGFAGKIDLEVKANWRLMVGIALDDYHLVAVHPNTFGKKGFLSPSATKYFRFGEHSLFVLNGAENAFETMVKECREQRFIPKQYLAFYFFPNLMVFVLEAVNILGDEYWYLYIQQLEPVSESETKSKSRFVLLPMSKPTNLVRRLTRKAIVPMMNKIFKRHAVELHREDNQVCENLQKVAHQIKGGMILSNQEQRVEWFEEVYAQHVQFKSNLE